MTENQSTSPLSKGSDKMPKALRPREDDPHTGGSPLARVPMQSRPQALSVDPDHENMSLEDMEALEKRIAEIRANRELHGERNGRLEYESRPGYVRRWVNDLINGRVDEFVRKGWAFVNGPDNKRVMRGVGVHEDGSGKLSGILMEIPKIIADEDFNKKQEIQDRTDEAIYFGTHQEAPGDKRYVPRDTPINFHVNNRSPLSRK